MISTLNTPPLSELNHCLGSLLAGYVNLYPVLLLLLADQPMAINFQADISASFSIRIRTSCP